KSLTDRNGNQTVLEYDGKGFVHTMTDPRGRVTTYERARQDSCLPFGNMYIGQRIPPCTDDAFCKRYWEQGSPYSERIKAAIVCQNQLCVLPCGSTQDCADLQGSSFNPALESCQNNVCTDCSSSYDGRVTSITTQGAGGRSQTWTLNWDTQVVTPH